MGPASKSKAPSATPFRSAASLAQPVIPGLDPGIPFFARSSGRLRRPSTLGALPRFFYFTNQILPFIIEESKKKIEQL